MYDKKLIKLYYIYKYHYFIKMLENKGYIYIRRNDWYNKYNACKLGKTLNIPERNSQYITGEIEREIF